jgi:CRP/FNR family transcriptional regulator, cyclic AMP receptor protein
VNPSPLPPSVTAIVPQTFLAKAPVDMVGELLSSGRRMEVPGGTRFKNTQAKPRLSIVLEGLVRIFMQSPPDRQITVRYARPGETLGLLAMLLGRKRPELYAQAVTPSVVWAFPPSRLRELALKSGPLAMALAQDCAAIIADAAEEMALVAFGSVRQRVARHLLDLAAADGHDDLVATVTPQELAKAVGSVREVIARVLKELDESGVTERSAQGVTILDASRLDVEARGVARSRR